MTAKTNLNPSMMSQRRRTGAHAALSMLQEDRS
jgi:hypothetical protein